MAVVDGYLVLPGRPEAPNNVLIAAAPGLGLPQLQSASYNFASLGYGDFFAAAVVGGILAAERGPQVIAAVTMVAVSIAWDQLFLVYDILPATIPPAVVLIGVEGWNAWRARRGGGARRGRAPRAPAAGRGAGAGTVGAMNVEIWSDIACPWCYVGKRRFEAALGAFEHRDEVTVTWRSFELDPPAPRERGV